MANNTITVVCDAPGCGWEHEELLSEVGKWHNAACPKCGAAPIISDDDMGILTLMNGLAELGLAKTGENITADDHGLPHIHVRIDTSGLHQ
jgi:hypothetical protein